MTVFGVSYVVGGWFALAILMSILLPLYFGLKFEWDPSTVEVDTADHESQAAGDEPRTKRGA